MSRPRKTDDVCGSTAGEKRHRRRGTTVCQPCLEAQANYQAERYRDRNGDRRLGSSTNLSQDQVQRAETAVRAVLGDSQDAQDVIDMLFGEAPSGNAAFGVP